MRRMESENKMSIKIQKQIMKHRQSLTLLYHKMRGEETMYLLTTPQTNIWKLVIYLNISGKMYLDFQKMK